MYVRRHNLAAFTLMELLLVMLIITVVAGLTAPMLMDFANGQRAGDAATHILALTRFAHAQAMSDGVTYRLNMQTDQGIYWLDTVTTPPPAQQTNTPMGNNQQQPETGKLLGTSVGQLYTLPEGLKLQCDAVNSQRLGVIHFFANGRTDPTTIRVMDERNTFVITCFSASEQYQIVGGN